MLEAARSSLQAWLELRGGTIEDYAFQSRTDYVRHLGTRQCARLVDEWVTAIGLRREDYGTHPLRRTKVSIIYKATGNLRAVQLFPRPYKDREHGAPSRGRVRHTVHGFFAGLKLGLEGQQASVQAFAAAQGWTLVAKSFEVASGKDDHRPGFQSALTRCRQLRAVLAAARLDRITRRAHTLSQLLEDGYSEILSR